MASVDSRIAMPRLETPRTRVPSGSVGIAGLQTGIYPCDSPGGWRIIGHTATKVFDPQSSNPFLLKAGDRVKFVAA
jgi:KipI family sensor histidine kinase inhibitor